MAETSPSPATVGQDGLKRDLKPRHLNMIAIGGAIGTGLFVASGASIANAGPGGALVAYVAIGFMVFLLMQSLGEMATWLPVAGSFEAYGTRYVSPSFGFATGWNYWFNWAITVAAELSAAALVMQYWLPDVPGWIWSGAFLLVLFTLNAATVKAFGEAEFWFAGIKVVTVVVFLAVGCLMIFGILSGPAPGTRHWGEGEAPFVNGFAGLLGIFMVAGFSFQGTELIAVAAGEAEDPDRSIPRAIRTVFFRILLFYVGAMLVIGFLIAYTDPRLLSSDIDNVSVSPFTIVFERAGIAGAASLLNAVILTSILSAGNSGMFASTRMLYGLARSGKAPKAFAKVTSRGVPFNALLATTVIACASFISSLIGEGGAYVWLVNASGLAGFLTWMGIAWSHYRFRKAFVAQGHDLSELPFRARWFPLGPLVALLMCAVVIIGQNYQAFLGELDIAGLLSSYIGLPLFLALWAGHKLVTKAPAVDLHTADLSRTPRAGELEQL